jgi:hypothetical protein
MEVGMKENRIPVQVWASGAQSQLSLLNFWVSSTGMKASEVVQYLPANRFKNWNLSESIWLLSAACAMCRHASKSAPVRNQWRIPTASWGTVILCKNVPKNVKVNLSLCLTKHHAMKTNWGSRCIDPRILNLGTRRRIVANFTLRPLYAQ